MSDWKQKISGCFSESSLAFAGHRLDEDRAFDLLKLLRDEGVGLRQVIVAFRNYLEEKGAGQDHIDRQIKKVEEAFRPWLLD